MKWFISILIIVGCGFGGYELYSYWDTFKQKEEPSRAYAPVDVNVGSQLPGLPANLAESLTQAQAQGGRALGQWLAHNHAKVRDPRLGWIQLDYVVLIAPSDLYEARKVFKEVQQRTDPASPIYPRLKQLEKTYVH